MKDFAEFLEKYPHNSDTTDRFMMLVSICYRMDKKGLSLEEFVQECLDNYGGTVAGAMVEYLNNR